MNKIFASSLLIIAGSLGLSSPLLAHAQIKPNSGLALRNTNTGNKTGPCGAGNRNANPTVFKPGDKFNFQWIETIQHPGRFIISFSEKDDANFQKIVEIQDTQDGPASVQNPHQYNTMITIPDKPCAACTLQLIQVMTENPANPTNYYSCADIKIEAVPTQPEAPKEPEKKEEEKKPEETTTQTTPPVANPPVEQKPESAPQTPTSEPSKTDTKSPSSGDATICE